MARIDFHSHVSDKLQYCCRLSRKIMASGDPQAQPRTIVITGNTKELKELDELMWTFSKTDFLPHAWLDDESAHETPILFVTNTDDLTGRAHLHQDILIYLHTEPPKSLDQLLQRFPRWIEVVTTQDDELKAGRERFKTYRSMGHELHHFDQSKNV
jgi:DNA polymerase-3 subunit chi